MDYQANNMYGQETQNNRGQARTMPVEEMPAEHDRTKRKPTGRQVENFQGKDPTTHVHNARPPGKQGMRAAHRRKGMLKVGVCWVALAATIACNALFETFKLGGVTSAEVSNQVFAWFTPAGYVFSIWGVIYAALAAWMVSETMRANKGRELSRNQMLMFALSCVLNVSWLVAFHFQQIGVALVVLIALWLDLALLYVGMRDDESRSRLNLAPFSIYFAWSTVAVIANATHLATRLIPTMLIVNQVSTIVLTLAVLAVAYLSVRNSKDYVFPLVILWATVGVGMHLANVDQMISTAIFVLSALGAVAMYLPLTLASRRASVSES